MFYHKIVDVDSDTFKLPWESRKTVSKAILCDLFLHKNLSVLWGKRIFSEYISFKNTTRVKDIDTF